MKCIDNTSEIEYYDKIINFYLQNMDYLENNVKTIDKWADFSYIRLMKELRTEKKLIDANLPDVVRNSIVLILCLFSKKCRNNRNNSIMDFSEEEKIEIKNLMLKTLEII